MTNKWTQVLLVVGFGQLQNLPKRMTFFQQKIPFEIKHKNTGQKKGATEYSAAPMLLAPSLPQRQTASEEGRHRPDLHAPRAWGQAGCAEHKSDLG
ncbi:hypothetical protein [Silvimonas amylolytica]|uniref:hypothetical protein n=1 Tax=Silvimonas amylolytica TaxID=449663 RepID=UPI001E5A9AC8|nr:hypothetical protein [Silvimonas amylolytica]